MDKEMRDDIDERENTQDTSSESSNLVRKEIGGMTYLVGIHFSDTSRDTFKDKIRRMIRMEMDGCP